MKNSVMRKFTLFFVFLLTIGNSIACHIAGGQITYRYLSSTRYEVTLTMYEECGCTSEIISPTIDITSSCYSDIELDMVLTSYSILDLGCSSVNMQCDGTEYDGLYAIEEKVWKGVVNLPGLCSDYEFIFEWGERSITDYAVNELFHVEAFLNNTLGPNNSPQINSQPLLYACDNEPFTFDNVVTEADGDVVTYSLVCPQIDFGNPISYSGAGINCTNPLPSSGGGFNISSDGLLTFTSNPLTNPKVSIMAIQITETRGGIVVGTIVRDMQVIVRECDNEPPTAGPPISSSANITTSSNIISAIAGTDGCFSITSADSDLQTGEQMSIEVLQSPDFAIPTVISNSDGTATIQFCLNSPIICEGGTFDIKLMIEDGKCPIPGRTYVNYKLILLPTDYCPEYRFFTNRNPTSGIPMVTFAKASNEIYVGDNMPAFSLISPSDMGSVIYSGDVMLEAGVEIIIPACVSGGGDCVILNGFNQTLVVIPDNCSPLCPPTPLEVEVTPIFECTDEEVVANVLNGSEPYTYQWTDVNGNVLSTSSTLPVHDLVSMNDWDDVIVYNLYIEDAVGNTYSTTGELNGTHRFYEPLWYNMYAFPEADFELNKWYCYPDNAIDTNAVYLYDGNFSVYYNYPMVIWDGINTTPPWYGATMIDFKVYDVYGHVIAEKIVDLQGTGDWSLDNYEFYWDGTLGNTGDPDDCVNSVGDISNYTVYAENCQTLPHCETGFIYHFACYDGNWNDSIWHVKSSEASNYGGVILDHSRIDTEPEVLSEKRPEINSSVDIYPNPANNFVFINGKGVEVQLIEIFDASGKLIISTNNIMVELSGVSVGAYSVRITTSEGVFTKKLIVS